MHSRWRRSPRLCFLIALLVVPHHATLKGSSAYLSHRNRLAQTEMIVSPLDEKSRDEPRSLQFQPLTSNEVEPSMYRKRTNIESTFRLDKSTMLKEDSDETRQDPVHPYVLPSPRKGRHLLEAEEEAKLKNEEEPVFPKPPIVGKDEVVGIKGPEDYVAHWKSLRLKISSLYDAVHVSQRQFDETHKAILSVVARGDVLEEKARHRSNELRKLHMKIVGNSQEAKALKRAYEKILKDVQDLEQQVDMEDSKFNDTALELNIRDLEMELRSRKEYLDVDSVLNAGFLTLAASAGDATDFAHSALQELGDKPTLQVSTFGEDPGEQRYLDEDIAHMQRGIDAMTGGPVFQQDADLLKMNELLSELLRPQSIADKIRVVRNAGTERPARVSPRSSRKVKSVRAGQQDDDNGTESAHRTPVDTNLSGHRNSPPRSTMSRKGRSLKRQNLLMRKRRDSGENHVKDTIKSEDGDEFGDSSFKKAAGVDVPKDVLINKDDSGGLIKEGEPAFVKKVGPSGSYVKDKTLDHAEKGDLESKEESKVAKATSSDSMDDTIYPEIRQEDAIPKIPKHELKSETDMAESSGNNDAINDPLGDWALPEVSDKDSNPLYKPGKVRGSEDEILGSLSFWQNALENLDESEKKSEDFARALIESDFRSGLGKDGTRGDGGKLLEPFKDVAQATMDDAKSEDIGFIVSRPKVHLQDIDETLLSLQEKLQTSVEEDKGSRTHGDRRSGDTGAGFSLSKAMRRLDQIEAEGSDNEAMYNELKDDVNDGSFVLNVVDDSVGDPEEFALLQHLSDVSAFTKPVRGLGPGGRLGKKFSTEEERVAFANDSETQEAVERLGDVEGTLRDTATDLQRKQLDRLRQEAVRVKNLKSRIAQEAAEHEMEELDANQAAIPALESNIERLNALRKRQYEKMDQDLLDAYWQRKHQGRRNWSTYNYVVQQMDKNNKRINRLAFRDRLPFKSKKKVNTKVF